MNLKQITNKLNIFGFNRFCPVCQKHARVFRDAGVPARKDVRCCHCGSLERHRLFWGYFEKELKKREPLSACRILHFAPESHIEKKIRSLSVGHYVTTDLFNDRVDVKSDIMNLPFEDNEFDLIICSHVLEHVQDDRIALKELKRVLRKGGIAVIMVPITSKITIEDPYEQDPKVRLEKFGQEDHYRRYGWDFDKRLQSGGFSFKHLKPEGLFSRNLVKKMRLQSSENAMYECL